MGALFGEAGIVDHHHPFAHRQQFHQTSLHGRPLPGRMRDEVLQAVVVPRIGDARPHSLHRFAWTVAEPPLQIAAQRHREQAGTETAFELLQGTSTIDARAATRCDGAPDRSVPTLSEPYNVGSSEVSRLLSGEEMTARNASCCHRGGRLAVRSIHFADSVIRSPARSKTSRCSPSCRR